MCGTASSSTPPVELTRALLLGLVRGVVEEGTAPRTGGPWRSTTMCRPVRPPFSGLLGLGRSAAGWPGWPAFGMRVSARSQNLTRERAAQVGVELAADKEKLLAASDFVSVHLALGDRTRGLLAPAELALLKPTACLINTSRAAIVDQDALLAALHEGRIASVDVFDLEPLPAGHPMRTAPRLLATPHLGYVSRANYATYFGQAVENIRTYLAGSPVRVSPSR